VALPFIHHSGGACKTGDSADLMSAWPRFERKTIMIRKTLIAVAAAATMALGMGAATAPAEAKVYINIGTPYVGYYHPHHYYAYHKRPPYHCHWKKVYRYGHWVKVKRCHRAWH
jgi:hypothetical protein